MSAALTFLSRGEPELGMLNLRKTPRLRNCAIVMDGKIRQIKPVPVIKDYHVRAPEKTIAKRFADATVNDLIPIAKYQHPIRLLQTAIEHYEIDLIIDVGANKGQFAGDMIKTGFKGETSGTSKSVS